MSWNGHAFSCRVSGRENNTLIQARASVCRRIGPPLHLEHVELAIEIVYKIKIYGVTYRAHYRQL